MVGGYQLDCLLADWLYQKCNDQFGLTLERNERLQYKLLVESEKVKMAFSSNAKSDVQFTVSSVYEGEDVEGSISKEEFDALCRGGDNFIETFYQFAISSIHEICGDRAIDDVKIVGCSMHLPVLQEELLKAVQHHGSSISAISTSMDMERACCRGCSIFSHLYWEEQSIRCGQQQVVLQDNGDDVVSMNVCCCSPVDLNASNDLNDPTAVSYSIQCNEPLKEGKDHDWHFILEEGAKFIDLFIQNCEELKQRQLSRTMLEQQCSELNVCLSSSMSESTLEREKTVEEDRALVQSVTDLVSLAKLQSRETYDIQIQTVKHRLRYYKDSMQIKTSDRVIDGLRFYGIWANGKMTGIFECYSNDKMKIHKYTASFVDGIFDGEMTTYYESKKIKTKQFYQQG